MKKNFLAPLFFATLFLVIDSQAALSSAEDKDTPPTSGIPSTGDNTLHLVLRVNAAQAELSHPEGDNKAAEKIDNRDLLEIRRQMEAERAQLAAERVQFEAEKAQLAFEKSLRSLTADEETTRQMEEERLLKESATALEALRSALLDFQGKHIQFLQLRTAIGAFSGDNFKTASAGGAGEQKLIHAFKENGATIAQLITLQTALEKAKGSTPLEATANRAVKSLERGGAQVAKETTRVVNQVKDLFGKRKNNHPTT